MGRQTHTQTDRWMDEKSEQIMMQSYEKVLKRVGDFGLFQKRFLVIYYISSLFDAYAILCGVFVVYTPPHRCFIPEIDFENSSEFQDFLPLIDNSNKSDILSNFIPIEYGKDDEPKWSQCYRFEDIQSNNSVTPFNRTIISCDKGWKYFEKHGVVSATMEFDLVCDDAWLKPLVVSIHMFGLMIGSLIGGILSDRFGRCFAVYFGWMMTSCSLLVTTFLPVWSPTYIFWFLLGFGLVTKKTSGVVLINEQIPSRHRHKASVLNMVMIALGDMIQAPINYLIPNWRHVLLAYAISQFLIAVPLYFFTNESLNWLLRNQNYKQVDALIKKIAKVNKRKVNAEEVSMQPDIETEKNQIEKNEEKPVSKSKLSYLDLLKISFLRRRLIIFSIAWFSLVISYHGLNINTNNIGGDRYVASFLIGAMELPGNFLCYIALPKLGGRKFYVFTSVMCGLMLLLTAIMINVAEWAVITCNMVGKLLISGSVTTLYMFIGDFFPTLLRNQAYGAGSFVSRFAGILIPYILYLGTHVLKEIPYLVMGGITIAAGLGMWFIPETKNCPMPDTIEDAEQQEKFRPKLPCCKSKDELETSELHSSV